jgi:hypothetical protein
MGLPAHGEPGDEDRLERGVLPLCLPHGVDKLRSTMLALIGVACKGPARRRTHRLDKRPAARGVDSPISPRGSERDGGFQSISNCWGRVAWPHPPATAANDGVHPGFCGRRLAIKGVIL